MRWGLRPKEIYVFEEDGTWMVAFNGKYFGPFQNRERAVEAALGSATYAAIAGEIPLKVLVEESGAFRIAA